MRLLAFAATAFTATTSLMPLAYAQSAGDACTGSSASANSIGQILRCQNGTYDGGWYTDSGKVHFDNDTASTVAIIQNTSATSVYTAGITLKTETGNQALLFLNTSNRTVDGGPGGLTLRNDAGNLRLQGAGGFNNTDGITVEATTGDVGVHTDSPAYDFDVNGTMRVADNAFFEEYLRTSGGGTATLPAIQPGPDNDTGIFWPGANTIGFTTLGTERMRITQSGFVGMGTDTVGAALHVSNTGLTSIFQSSRVDAGIGNVVAIRRPDSVGGWIRFEEDNANTVLNIGYDSTVAYVVTADGYDLRINTEGNNGVTIADDGKVLVNKTTGGSANLDVNGDLRASSVIESGYGSGSVALTTNDGGGNANVTFNHRGKVSDSAGNVGRIVVNTDATTNANMQFQVANNSTAGATVTASSILTINADGEVGINEVNPSYALHVEGTAYATGAAGSLSDRRHKKEITAIPEGALQKIEDLKPVSFLWKEALDKGMEGIQLGFIAQDVQTVLPEAILKQDNEEHTLGLKYNSFMPIVVKAMQEQQTQIEALKTENTALKSELQEMRTRLQVIEEELGL